MHPGDLQNAHSLHTTKGGWAGTGKGFVHEDSVFARRMEDWTWISGTRFNSQKRNHHLTDLLLFPSYKNSHRKNIRLSYASKLHAQ
jgi:hypothetical protein